MEQTPFMKAMHDFAMADPENCDRVWAACVALAKEKAAPVTSPTSTTSSLHHRAHATAAAMASPTASSTPASTLAIPRASTGAANFLTCGAISSGKDDLSPGARRIYDYIVGDSDYLDGDAAAPVPDTRFVFSEHEAVHGAVDVANSDIGTMMPTNCSSECPSHDAAVPVSALSSSAASASSTAIGDALSELATPVVSVKATVRLDTTLLAVICLPVAPGHNTSGDDPVTMLLTPWSATPSFNAPLETLTTTVSVKLMGQAVGDMLFGGYNLTLHPPWPPPAHVFRCKDMTQQLLLNWFVPECTQLILWAVKIPWPPDFPNSSICIQNIPQLDCEGMSLLPRTSLLSLLVESVERIRSRLGIQLRCLCSQDVQILVFCFASCIILNQHSTLDNMQLSGKCQVLKTMALKCSAILLVVNFVPGVPSVQLQRTMFKWPVPFCYDTHFPIASTSVDSLLDLSLIRRAIGIFWTGVYIDNLHWSPGGTTLALPDWKMLNSSMETWVHVNCDFVSMHFQWAITEQQSTSPGSFLAILNERTEVQQRYTCESFLPVAVYKGWIYHLILGGNHYFELMQWSFSHTELQSAFWFFTPGHILFSCYALVQWKIPWINCLEKLQPWPPPPSIHGDLPGPQKQKLFTTGTLPGKMCRLLGCRSPTLTDVGLRTVCLQIEQLTEAKFPGLMYPFSHSATLHHRFLCVHCTLLSSTAANYAMVQYLHCKRPPNPDESPCVSSRYFVNVLLCFRIGKGQPSASAVMLQTYKFYSTRLSSWKDAMQVVNQWVLTRYIPYVWHSLEREPVLDGYDSMCLTDHFIQIAYLLMQWKISWIIILVSLRSWFQCYRGQSELLSSWENLQWTTARSISYHLSLSIPWLFSCPLLVQLVELKNVAFSNVCMTRPTGSVGIGCHTRALIAPWLACVYWSFSYLHIIWFRPLLASGIQFCLAREACYGAGQIQWEIAWPTTTLSHSTPNGMHLYLIPECSIVICYLEIEIKSLSTRFISVLHLHLDPGGFACHWLRAEPKIWALLCFYEFFAKAAAQGRIMVESPTYCYCHYIEAFFDQTLFSHDYYINFVQVNCNHIYYISFHYNYDPGKMKEYHLPWDPGGSTFHRLGVKPKFMEEGLSATTIYTGPGPDGGLPTTMLGPTRIQQGTTKTQESGHRRLGLERKGIGRWLRPRPGLASVACPPSSSLDSPLLLQSKLVI